MVELAEGLLVEAKYVCIDATRDISPYRNGILYTIVIRHNVAGRGVSAAYLFTNNQSAESLVNWFRWLQKLGVHPVKVIIDCSLPEYNAIGAVWVNKVAVQYCTWHVARTCMQQILAKVDCQDPQKKEELTADLREDLLGLMRENDREAFLTHLDEFKVKCAEQTRFIEYFLTQWVNGEKCV